MSDSINAKAVIALDMDGTILNYGSHTTETRSNYSLLPMLPLRGAARVAILTNQGGMAFSRYNPAKYPTPERVAERIYAAVRFLREAGYPVEIIMASCYHPRAEHVAIQSAAAKLRSYMPQFGVAWRVYTAERARKPHPLMLKAAGATIYYGDSPEDAAAAANAGIPFVAVPRFE